MPLILGMPFFEKVAPRVDWQAKKVFVKRGRKRFQLPVLKFGTSVQGVHVASKSWPSVTLQCTNTFEGLCVEDGNEIVNDDVQLLTDDVSNVVVAQK